LTFTFFSLKRADQKTARRWIFAEAWGTLPVVVLTHRDTSAIGKAREMKEKAKTGSCTNLAQQESSNRPLWKGEQNSTMTVPGDNNHPERLPRPLQRTVNHDLPNAVVALKGMVQLLEREEAERLSPAGRDYLARLAGIAERLQAIVTSLRSYNKVAQSQTPPEKIALADFLREAAAAAGAGLPGRKLDFHLELWYSALTAPRLLLLQALVEALQLLGEVANSQDVHYYIASQPAPGEIRLILGNFPAATGATKAEAENTAAAGPPDVESPAGDRYDRAGPEQRLRLILLEEIARSWGGSLTAQSMAGQGLVLILSLPTEKPPVSEVGGSVPS
jgi:light-regulated signal transduction histidine kinase (bacteriophytochrome)